MKNILFKIIAILLSVLMLEGASFVLLSMQLGGLGNMSALQMERKEVLLTTETYQRGLNEEVGWRREVVMHPYVGYLDKRQRNPVRRKAKDAFIIGITGGSVAAGFVASKKLEFIETLKSHPALADKEIAVISLATGGYRQPQQLLMLTHLLSLGAEFDAIINIDGFNDIAVAAHSHLEYDMPADFPRDWYFKIRRSLPDAEILGDIGILNLLRKFRRSLANYFSISPWNLSPTLNLVWRNSDVVLAAQISQLNNRVTEEAARSIKDKPTLPDFIYEKPTHIYRYLTDLWVRSSILMKRLADRNGIAYYHYLQPNQYLPDTKHFTQTELTTAYLQDSGFKPHIERGYPLLREASSRLKDEGIQYYDLTQIFKKREDTIYIDSCCHFNEQGFDLMMNEIVRTMFPK